MMTEQRYNPKYRVSVPTEESLQILNKEQKKRYEMTELDFSSNYVMFMNQAIKLRDLLGFLDSNSNSTEEIDFSSKEFVRLLQKTLWKQSRMQKLNLCFERDMDNGMIKVVKSTLPRCPNLKQLCLDFQRCEEVNIPVIIDFLHYLLQKSCLQEIKFSFNTTDNDDTDFLRIKKLLKKYFRELDITFKHELPETKTCIFSGSQKPKNTF